MVVIHRSLALLTVALVLLQAGPDDAAKKDLQRLQGRWVMTALEVDGKDVGVEKVQGTDLTIKGTEYAVKVKDKLHACTIRLNPKEDPPAVDMIFNEPGSGEKVLKGIYKIDGDVLRICRGLSADQARPRQLATWPGTSYFVVTWRRQAP